MIDATDVPPADEQGVQLPPPTIAREGGRAWVDTPLDSPYFTRLNKFGAHWDGSRWWVGIAKVDALEQLLKFPLGSPVDEPEPEPEPQQSAATRLVELARDQYTLGITDMDEAYGVHPDRPHIALMLRGGKTGLRQTLSRAYFADSRTAVPQQALADACGTLEGFAMETDPAPVHLRVAQGDNGAVYVDMANTEDQVIEFCGGAYTIRDDAPGVLFRRTKLTSAMPTPVEGTGTAALMPTPAVEGGEIAALWDLIPIDENDRPLILAWLVHALIQPDVAHTILLLAAEHGSAKSTITRWLVNLIDPSPAPLRKAPRDADAWVVAASASWVVALENLSGVIPLWFSDSLCRASTGDGDVRRQLYTDGDVAVFAFRRIVVINGIDVTVTQGDLADRLLRVSLPRIGEDKRKTDEEIAKSWHEAQPAILGALLTLAADVHQRLTKIEVPNLPRMADYAKVLAAVDAVLGTKGLAYYREQCKNLAADTLDAPFIAHIVTERYACIDSTSAEILAAVEKAAVSAAKGSESVWRAPKGWPTSAREVTNQLTRHAPALRTQGWTVEDDGGSNHRNAILWTLDPPAQQEKVCKPDAPNSPDSQSANKPRSNDMFGRESDRESGIGPNSPDSRDSQSEPPLTSEDELASHASQECSPSLVDDKGLKAKPDSCRCTTPGWCPVHDCYSETDWYESPRSKQNTNDGYDR
jgi:hypothetical protein